MEKMGEGMRIHISLASKELLDRVMLTIQKALKNNNVLFRWVDSAVTPVDFWILG